LASMPELFAWHVCPLSNDKVAPVRGGGAARCSLRTSRTWADCAGVSMVRAVTELWHPRRTRTPSSNPGHTTRIRGDQPARHRASLTWFGGVTPLQQPRITGGLGTKKIWCNHLHQPRMCFLVPIVSFGIHRGLVCEWDTELKPPPSERTSGT